MGWLFKSRLFNLYIKKGYSFLYLSFSSINLLKSCYLLKSYWFCLVWHDQAFGLLHFQLHLILYLPATLNKVCFFRAETLFVGYFLTASAISRLRLGFTSEQEYWPKCFTNTFSPERGNSQNFLASQDVLFEWWPKLLQRPFRLNCLRLTFLNSIRYRHFSLWHSKEPRQVAKYWSPLKPLLLLSLNGPQCLPSFIESKILSVLIGTSKSQLPSISNGSWLVWLMLVSCQYISSTYILQMLVCLTGTSNLPAQKFHLIKGGLHYFLNY